MCAGGCVGVNVHTQKKKGAPRRKVNALGEGGAETLGAPARHPAPPPRPRPREKGGGEGGGGSAVHCRAWWWWWCRRVQGARPDEKNKDGEPSECVRFGVWGVVWKGMRCGCGGPWGLAPAARARGVGWGEGKAVGVECVCAPVLGHTREMKRGCSSCSCFLSLPSFLPSSCSSPAVRQTEPSFSEDSLKGAVTKRTHTRLRHVLLPCKKWGGTSFG